MIERCVVVSRHIYLWFTRIKQRSSSMVQGLSSNQWILVWPRHSQPASIPSSLPQSWPPTQSSATAWWWSVKAWDRWPQQPAQWPCSFASWGLLSPGVVVLISHWVWSGPENWELKFFKKKQFKIPTIQLFSYHHTDRNLDLATPLNDLIRRPLLKTESQIGISCIFFRHCLGQEPLVIRVD